MRLRRLGCGVLAIILSLPLALPVVSHAGYFDDVTGHWAEFYISKVYNENIITGYPNGRFQPDKAVTRAEFIAMVNKVYDLDYTDSEEYLNYNDIPYTAWYYNDASTAIALGYAAGYSDGTFKPNSPITRQEAAVMLSNLMPAPKKGGNLKSFSDVKKLDTTSTEAFTKLIGKGYLGGYSDKKLHPSDPVTRAQAAKMLSDIMDNEDIVTSRTVVDEDKTTLTAKTYVGDVLIDEDLEDGSATIDNCVILGDLLVEGGGNGTITLNNTRVANAIINRENGPVRVVTKGNTVVQKLEANETCSLQTSGKGGFGFPSIRVRSSADLSLKGTYPSVSIEGSKASVTLLSGEITSLMVSRSGKYSDITLTGKSKIAQADVNAECYFHGAGSVALMAVNADDVTYETKPDKMTVGVQSDRPESEGDEDVSVTFKPKNRAEDVDVDTKVTITFNTAMKLVNGSEISASNVKSFITFSSGATTSGTAVAYTATVNSAKKVITLTPSAKLTKGTKYYVILTRGSLKNIGGNKNGSEKISFTTEGEAPSPTPPAVTVTPPALSGFALTATSSGITAASITMHFTPNVAGTVYGLATTGAITSPTADQIIAANITTPATASTAGALTFSGLNAATHYYVYALLRNTSSTSSAIVSSEVNTP